jgi:hypothetical protein
MPKQRVVEGSNGAKIMANEAIHRPDRNKKPSQ